MEGAPLLSLVPPDPFSNTVVASWPLARRPHVPIRGVRSIVSPFDYDGGAGDAVRSVKYGGATRPVNALADRVADLLTLCWPDQYPDGDSPAIVPVPSTAWKTMLRGFNLPALLGRRIAHRLHLPFRPEILNRRDFFPRPQAGLLRRDRRAAVAGVFRAAAPPFPGAPVILVDDVVTSGATVSSAAAELHRAGWGEVVVASVCHAGPAPGPASGVPS